MKNNKGYIFILTLMMIATATVIGTYIFIRGSIYVPYMHTMIQREKAKELALGGLQIAVSQLGYIKSDQKNKNKKQGEDQTAQAKQFLTTILPVINRWQNFPLKEKIDGINGEIKICIVCEDGKININQIYDFTQHKFKGEKQTKGNWKKITEIFLKRVGRLVGGKDLFSAFEKFLKKQKYKLNDVTQLLTIKEFASFKNKIFYEPPAQKRKGPIKETIYLTDLFTVFPRNPLIQPWLLSNSMLGALRLKQVKPNDTQSREKSVKKWLKNFRPTVQSITELDTMLAPMYKKGFTKGLDGILNTAFEPKWFSVLSYGRVGKVTVRCVAIMERIKRASNGKTGYDVSLRKLYWL